MIPLHSRVNHGILTAPERPLFPPGKSRRTALLMRGSPRAAGLVLLLFLLSHAWPRVHSKGNKKTGDNRCAMLGKAAAVAGGYKIGARKL